MPNIIYIKAFGMVAEKIGSNSLELENPGSAEILKQRLYERFPELKTIKFGLAVDRKMLHSDAEINPGAEVALLPPFSGG
jgi:molybdopterin synthase sulfur carrier subunit